MTPIPYRHLVEDFIVFASPCTIQLGGVVTDGLSYVRQGSEDKLPMVVMRADFDEHFVPVTRSGPDFYAVLHQVLDKATAYEYAQKLELLVSQSKLSADGPIHVGHAARLIREYLCVSVDATGDPDETKFMVKVEEDVTPQIKDLMLWARHVSSISASLVSLNSAPSAMRRFWDDFMSRFEKVCDAKGQDLDQVFETFANLARAYMSMTVADHRAGRGVFSQYRDKPLEWTKTPPTSGDTLARSGAWRVLLQWQTEWSLWVVQFPKFDEWSEIMVDQVIVEDLQKWNGWEFLSLADAIPGYSEEMTS